MQKKFNLLMASLLAGAIGATAQDTLGTRIGYDLSSEMAVGTGRYTASQLAANRHHVLPTRPNTAYLRAAVTAEHAFTEKLKLTGKVDVVGGLHADHPFYLQQCFANLTYGPFFIEAGNREQPQVVRDNLLSTGSFTKGTNAKPIPQVHFGTTGFWDVPLTRKWVQINFDFGYGKFMDSGYREDKFWQTNHVNSNYATGAYYHQKHLYIRSNPEKTFFAMVGIEHAVQLGGTEHFYQNGELVTKEKTANLKAFWRVILPIGDSKYFEKDVLEDWIYGNHVGVMTYQIGWNINKNHRLQAYLDNPFEDGSGVRKGNGYDGLWGLQYNNRTKGRQLVRSAVVEYFQTTNQSGPLHWDPMDNPEPIRSQITDMKTGRDDYYNHMFYNSYSYYGMTPGNPLITSPIYNEDGFTGYRDNRIKAWHLGVNGEITPRLSYLVKGNYQEGWGLYTMPLERKHYTFGAMFQGIYAVGAWQFAAAYAFDKGNVYGDCSTFNLKIGFHGKLL